jgi:hypothetical protein
LSGFDWFPRRILSDLNDRRGVCDVKATDEGNYRSCRRDAPQEGERHGTTTCHFA